MFSSGSVWDAVRTQARRIGRELDELSVREGAEPALAWARSGHP